MEEPCGHVLGRADRRCTGWRRSAIEAPGSTLASAPHRASAEPEGARRRCAEEQGGGRRRRQRAGLRWASRNLNVILPILFAFRRADAQPLSVNFPDGTARTVAGQVTVPQGKGLEMAFTGRSMLPRCSRLPALIAPAHATRQQPPQQCLTSGPGPRLLPSPAARSHRGQAPVQQGDAVSIIAGNKNCRLRSDLDQTPPGVSNILLDAHMRAVFDFSEIKPSAGYKLCVCPASAVEVGADGHHCPDDSSFEEDIQFSVQNLMQGLDLKGVTAGTSVCASLHTSASRLSLCPHIPSTVLFCVAAVLIQPLQIFRKHTISSMLLHRL